MRTSLRLACVILAIAAGAQLLFAQYGLQVIQKFPENSAGKNNQVKFADVNGDGIRDMIASYTPSSTIGQVIGIWFGHGTRFSDSVDCTINLTFKNKQCWFNVADVNGDGKADIVAMSHYGGDHPPKIVYGKATMPKTITTPDKTCEFPVDPDFSTWAQYTSVIVGDFNADGYQDFAYPEQGTTISLGENGGRLVMYFGGPNLTGKPGMVFRLPGWYDGIEPTFFTAQGDSIFLRWYSPFISTGDFNGDGKLDIFTAGYYSFSTIYLKSLTANKTIRMDNSGVGLVYFGGADIDTVPDVLMLPPNDFLQYTSTTDYMYCGYWVFGAGDINGDGADELSLPSWYWGVNFVYPGVKGMTQAPSDGEAVVLRDPMFYFTKDRYNSMGYADQNGAMLIPVGDINGDHVPDMANSRNYYGNGPDDPGVRFFFLKKTSSGSVPPDFVTADYSQVQASNIDFDGDGRADLVMNDLDGHLCLVKLTLPGQAVDETSGPLPAHFVLGQNYPNPFNPTTTITYQLPKASHVMLRVYDALGRLAATLLDQDQAPGAKSILVDASHYASGNYFYRLSTDGFTQTRMMTVMK